MTARTHTVKANTLSALATLKPETVSALTAQATSISARSFDPVDFIKEYISADKPRANVLSRLVWKLDITLVNQLTALYFAMLKAAQEDGLTFGDKKCESYFDFTVAMDVRENRETHLVEQGFMQSEGIESIRILLGLRGEWHSMIEDQRHIMPSIETLILSQKPQALTAISKDKLLGTIQEMVLKVDMLEARKLCDADKITPEQKEMIKTLLADAVAREALMASQRHELVEQRTSAMIAMAHFIGNTDVDTDVDFCNLPLETRKSIIEDMKPGISQAIDRLMKDKAISFVEFAGLRTELVGASDVISKVLSSDHFDEDNTERNEASTSLRDGMWQRPSEKKHAERKDILARNAA